MGWNGLGKAGQLLFSVVKIDNFFVGGGGVGKKLRFAAGQSNVIAPPSRSPLSLTPQSNGNVVGKGNRSNGYGDKGGGQAMVMMAMMMATSRAMATATRWWATKRAMVRVARAMARVSMVAGN